MSVSDVWFFLLSSSRGKQCTQGDIGNCEERPKKVIRTLSNLNQTDKIESRAERERRFRPSLTSGHYEASQWDRRSTRRHRPGRSDLDQSSDWLQRCPGGSSQFHQCSPRCEKRFQKVKDNRSLTVKKFSQMEVTIKHSPTQFKVSIPDSATVRDLKRQIASQISCRVSACRLIFDGIVLKNTSLFSSYNVPPDRSITLILDESQAPRPASATVPTRPLSAHTHENTESYVAEQDEQFYDAVLQSPLREKFARPRVLGLLTDLARCLDEIPDGNFADVCARLRMVPVILKNGPPKGSIGGRTVSPAPPPARAEPKPA
jgi:hypothetical protein